MAWKADDICVMYNYNAISSVSQTTSVNESIVAWKVDAPIGECPKGTNAPTFDNQNATVC